jgi:type II secretory ATPase GspE/PulE/Tfp pilus assembly ATPase PilB-like protein
MEEENKKILGAITITPEIIEEVKKGVKNIADFQKKVEANLKAEITELLNIILFSAIQLGASDVHVEPEENQARLRVRIDGILHDVIFFEPAIYRQLVSRLKLLSKLKLNIIDKPQDGRFSINIEDPSINSGQVLLIEMRTSSLPAEHGEAIVMRILNPKNLIGLEALGLRKDLYKLFEKEITKPNGMIIVTGPTGSGKTTTLYAFLMKIQSPEIKIITIEDPIEYHLNGVSQTQVSPEKGYTFSEGLRSIVRQDPDTILVGEVRDLETAKIALQAALTGHLVLSTLHTNDASGTIPRLVDLGADPASIAPALKMAIAQRLVRKACKNCATFAKPSTELLAVLQKGLKNLPKDVDVPDLKKIKVAKIKEKGCEKCNFTGYKGRKGLYEAFLVDAEMEKFILTKPAISAVRELAIKKGMVTMWQSGLIDVALGETTLEEIQKSVEEE